MRLLCMLGLGCLLSNGMLGGHSYNDTILRLHREAEEKIMFFYRDSERLEKELCVPKITLENFFKFLMIYTCAMSLKEDGEEELLDKCRKKAKEMGCEVLGTSTDIATCLYYFEEMYCIGNEHQLNAIAVGYRRERVLAMIDFLKHSNIPEAKELEKQKIINIYQECIKAYEENSSAYIQDHCEPHGEEWTSTGCTY